MTRLQFSSSPECLNTMCPESISAWENLKTGDRESMSISSPQNMPRRSMWMSAGVWLMSMSVYDKSRLVRWVSLCRTTWIVSEVLRTGALSLTSVTAIGITTMSSITGVFTDCTFNVISSLTDSLPSCTYFNLSERRSELENVVNTDPVSASTSDPNLGGPLTLNKKLSVSTTPYFTWRWLPVITVNPPSTTSIIDTFTYSWGV